MKKIFISIIAMFFLLLSGCSCNPPELTLTKADWHTTTEIRDGLTFGFVHLSVSGTTNGDRVTVITYGDGIISEEELSLDQENSFDQDIIIKFTHMADNEFQVYSTVITAYRGHRTTKINLESKALAYLE